MNRILRFSMVVALSITASMTSKGQPEERDYLKYRQDKLQAFINSMQPNVGGTKGQRAPELFQLSEKAKTGFSLPEYGNWFNTLFPPTLKEQDEIQSTVIVFDLFDLQSDAFIHAVVAQLGGFKNLKIRGIVKNSVKDASEEMVLKRLQKINPNFPFVLVSNYKSLNGIDTLTVPSAVLVQTGMQPSIQIKSIPEIAEMASVCQKMEAIVKNVQSPSKGASFSHDSRLVRTPESVLFHPKGAIKSGGQFFISDTGNNRILVISNEGDITQIFGNRKSDLKDGKETQAAFSHPTGLAWDSKSEYLYVADTHNHSIRRVDLATGLVTTILGTGQPSNDKPTLVLGTKGSISFPYELELLNDKLYIAMAGFNEVWAMDLRTNEAKPVELASAKKKKKKKTVPLTVSNPTGLIVNGSKSMTVSSAFHGTAIKSEGKNAQVLFDPKSDGKKGIRSVYDLLQVDEQTYFTDPLGHSLWVEEKGTLKQLIGANGPGMADGKSQTAKLFYPCGLSYSGGVLFISDSFNDAIRMYNISEQKLTTLALNDYDRAIADRRNPVGNEGVIYAEPIEISEKATVRLKVKMPEGMLINAYKNNRVELMEENGIEFMGADFDENILEFSISKSESTRQLYFEMELHLSQLDTPGQVFYRSCRVLMPITFTPTGKNHLETSFQLFPGLTD